MNSSEFYCILIHYDEIATKLGNRNWFEKQLIQSNMYVVFFCSDGFALTEGARLGPNLFFCLLGQIKAGQTWYNFVILLHFGSRNALWG